MNISKKDIIKLYGLNDKICNKCKTVLSTAGFKIKVKHNNIHVFCECGNSILTKKNDHTPPKKEMVRDVVSSVKKTFINIIDFENVKHRLPEKLKTFIKPYKIKTNIQETIEDNKEFTVKIMDIKTHVEKTWYLLELNQDILSMLFNNNFYLIIHGKFQLSKYTINDYILFDLTIGD